MQRDAGFLGLMAGLALAIRAEGPDKDLSAPGLLLMPNIVRSQQIVKAAPSGSRAITRFCECGDLTYGRAKSRVLPNLTRNG